MGELHPPKPGYQEMVEMLHLLKQQKHGLVVLDADNLMDNPGMLFSSRLCSQSIGLTVEG